MPVVPSSCPSQLDTQVEPGILTGAAPTECLHRRARSRCTKILCPSSSYLPATHFRISAGLPRLSCLSIAKLFNLLFSVLLQRPSSQLSGIISSYNKDVTLPGLQRNMEREMMMNVRSKRWKRESGVVSSQTQYQACWSWAVLARFEYGTS